MGICEPVLEEAQIRNTLVGMNTQKAWGMIVPEAADDSLARPVMKYLLLTQSAVKI